MVLYVIIYDLHPKLAELLQYGVRSYNNIYVKIINA